MCHKIFLPLVTENHENKSLNTRGGAGMKTGTLVIRQKRRLRHFPDGQDAFLLKVLSSARFVQINP
jgi:hypothetical protein